MLLQEITHDIETGMGIEGSRKLHMWFMPGENPQVPKVRKIIPIIMYMVHVWLPVRLLML